MTKNENKVLWAAIHREQRPLIGGIRKTIFFVSLIAVAVGLGLRYSATQYGYLLVSFGIFGLFVTILTMQDVYSLRDEEFRNKPLRIQTIEKLRISLGNGLLDDLMRLKENNIDKCLHVKDILDMLESTEKETQDAMAREVAQMQHAALRGSNKN